MISEQESALAASIHFSEDTIQKNNRRMRFLNEHEKVLQPFTITIIVAKNDDFLSTTSRLGSDLSWSSDESNDRGGKGLGPSPLSYFLSSMAFCQFVHYAEHAMDQKLRIASLEMKVEGKASMQRPRRFTEVTYEVKITSPESAESIRNLTRTAADECYVTNTLKLACDVKGIVILNGKILDQH